MENKDTTINNNYTKEFYNINNIPQYNQIDNEKDDLSVQDAKIKVIEQQIKEKD